MKAEKRNRKWNDVFRICARCQLVHISQRGCPICGFATYNSVWAVGWWKTILGLVTRRHHYVSTEDRM